MAEKADGDRFAPLFRGVLALLGLVLVVAGCVATFESTNDVGAASLVAGGFAFAALAYLGDRITRLKFKEFEAELGAVKDAVELVGAASVAQGAGDPARAENLRAEAMGILNQLGSVGRYYEELRRTMPAGSERTNRMEQEFAELRRRSRVLGVTADHVRQLVASDTEGDRLAALAAMEEIPETRDFDLVLGLVANPKTPFEHYHSLLVAKEMVPGLDERRQQRLTDIVSRQLAGDFLVPHLDADSSRRKLIEDILQVARI